MRNFGQALFLCLLLISAPQAQSVIVTPAELAEARRWAAARFEGVLPAAATQSAAEAQKNAPGGPPGQLVDTLYSTEAPFSFVYGGKASADLLKDWKCERTSRKLDKHRKERTSVWTEPATGLQVRCVGIEYDDFPTVEWVVHFKNTGVQDTPILSDIQGVDLALARRGTGEFVLNHNAGDNCSPSSYEPERLTLEPNSEHRFAPAGGRPTSVGFPYFNLEWPDEGLIIVIGWPGQWAAQFTRDAANGLRVRGGQELTHFKLHPGEEARSPLIALQFWQGDRVRAQNVWRRWMLAHNLPRTRDGKLPPPLFASCSGGFFPGLRTSEDGRAPVHHSLHASGGQTGLLVD